MELDEAARRAAPGGHRRRSRAAEAQELAGLGATAAAEDRPHPREQFARLEGLGQVVVGPHLETDDAVHGVAAGGEHQDRRVLAAADGPADLQPVDVGQRQVEKDEIEAALAVAGNAAPAVSGTDQAKPASPR